MDATQLPGVGVVNTGTAVDLTRARTVAATVVDPEIPVLTIEDLGILRDVVEEAGHVVVTITPTYSGCPAMGQIEDDVLDVLRAAGFEDPEVRLIHSPAWTTDWMSAQARAELAGFGIAPPTARHEILCPNCRAAEPIQVSEFGSTACKALMVCNSCGEPFDYFKEF